MKTILFLLISCCAVLAGQPPAEDVNAVVEHLLKRVAQADGVFLRNGKEHSPADAAEHMRKKYEHFRNKIKTPEDFIRLAGTRSLVSKKPYKIRWPDGREVTTETYLKNLLKKARHTSHVNPTMEGEAVHQSEGKPGTRASSPHREATPAASGCGLEARAPVPTDLFHDQACSQEAPAEAGR